GARERPCSPVDVRAAIELRGIARSGERILPHVDADDPKAALLFRSVLAAFSRTFVTGTGLRVIPGEAFSMARSDIEPTGFRARAFWKTLNTDLLDDMKVDYLYLDPDSLPADLYRRLREARRLERVIRQEAPGGGAVREVYRVGPRATSPEVGAP